MPAHGRVVVVGVGLIGGSIGLALRQRQLTGEVVGLVRSEASAERAKAAGVVDRVTTDAAEAASGADCVVLCTPVGAIVPSLELLAPHLSPSTLVTDAGSTKAGVVRDAQSLLATLPEGPAFVGAHPLAGDHRTGPEAARGDLFEGRTVVVTPTDATPASAVQPVCDFWQSLGAETRQMSPQEHDTAVARTSHLPHVVAWLLARATPDAMLPLTATSWRESTRIAAAAPDLWVDILTANRDEVLEAMRVMRQGWTELEHALADNDTARLREILDEAKRSRDASDEHAVGS